MQIPGVNSNQTVQPTETRPSAQAVAGGGFDSTRSTLTSMAEDAGSERCCVSKLFSCIGSLAAGLWKLITGCFAKPEDKGFLLEKAKSSLQKSISADPSYWTGSKAQIVIRDGDHLVWSHQTLYTSDILDSLKAEVLPPRVLIADNLTIDILMCKLDKGKWVLGSNSSTEKPKGLGTGSTGTQFDLTLPNLEAIFALRFDAPADAGFRAQLVEYFTT